MSSAFGGIWLRIVGVVGFGGAGWLSESVIARVQVREARNRVCESRPRG